MSEEKTILDLAKAGAAQQEASNPGSPQVPVSNQRQEDSSVSDALSELLSKVESKGAWVPVKLPSLGKYNEGLGDTIELRPFNFEDEKILRSVKNMTDIKNAVTTLFNRCTRGIPYPQMSLVDKSYLLFKLREISYGAEYPIEAECQSCQTKNELTIELDKLGTNYASDDASAEMTIMLPDSEVEASIRIPRTVDEPLLDNPAALMDNLWRFVTRVGTHTERIIIQNFITKTSARDVAVIRESIFGDKAGLETKVMFRCLQCDSEQITELPLNENFFSVN